MIRIFERKFVIYLLFIYFLVAISAQIASARGPVAGIYDPVTDGVVWAEPGEDPHLRVRPASPVEYVQSQGGSYSSKDCDPGIDPDCIDSGLDDFLGKSSWHLLWLVRIWLWSARPL